MPREKRKGPADVADLVRGLQAKPKPKKGRDRGWEKRKRNDPETTQVSYRGIPRELNEAIKTLAREKSLTVSEVAAQLLAVGLEEVKSGRRDLS